MLTSLAGLALNSIPRSIAPIFLLAAFALSGVSHAEPNFVEKPARSVVVKKQQGVNINSASVDQLAAGLSGVGKAKAQAIVDFRTANGPFKHVEELVEVKGIGEAILAKNRDRISL